jgi:hypothetical protein
MRYERLILIIASYHISFIFRFWPIPTLDRSAEPLKDAFYEDSHVVCHEEAQHGLLSRHVKHGSRLGAEARHAQ